MNPKIIFERNRLKTHTDRSLNNLREILLGLGGLGESSHQVIDQLFITSRISDKSLPNKSFYDATQRLTQQCIFINKKLRESRLVSGESATHLLGIN